MTTKIFHFGIKKKQTTNGANFAPFLPAWADLFRVASPASPCRRRLCRAHAACGPRYTAVNGNVFFSFCCRPRALTGSSLVGALSSGPLGEVPAARDPTPSPRPGCRAVERAPPPTALLCSPLLSWRPTLSTSLGRRGGPHCAGGTPRPTLLASAWRPHPPTLLPLFDSPDTELKVAGKK